MIPSLDSQGSFVLDAHGLDALRLQAKQNPNAALKGAAQQFEAIFLQTLLKSMRDASSQDGPFDNEETRTYTAMLDQQLAQSLSTRGIGLADAMLKQLSRNGVPPPAGAPENAQIPSIENRPLENRPRSEGSAPAAPHAASFLERMKEHAADASRTTGIPATFLMGQAALESGWGRHEIRGADGTQSFNLFGIKAGRGWNGPSVEAATTEYVDGMPRRVTQKFRAYGSYAESFQDYARLIQGNPRYAAVLGRQDGAGFAHGLQQAGYASDPQYADKLVRVLKAIT